MVKTRPFLGSTTTMEPLYGPSASTAAFRTSRSSPSTASPSVESLNVGSSQVWTHRVARGRLTVRLAGVTATCAGATAGLTREVLATIRVVAGMADAVAGL